MSLANVTRRRPHWTEYLIDPVKPKDKTRRIQNWSNWLDLRSNTWRETNPQAAQDSAPYNWQGNYDFQYQALNGPCQAFVGDSTDPSNRCLWGLRRADNTGAWINFKLLDVNAVDLSVNNLTKTASWIDAQQNTDLFLRYYGNRVQKYFRIKGTRPASFHLAMRLPPGYAYQVVGNSFLRILDSEGVEQFRTEPLSGVSGTMAGPNEEPDAVRFGGTLVENDPITVGGKSFPTFLLTPDANAVSDILTAGDIAWFDPTTTLSGAANIDDAQMLLQNGAAAENYNYGANTFLRSGVLAPDLIYRTLVRLDHTSFPAGTITAFRKMSYLVTKYGTTNLNIYFYRVSAANSAWAEGTSTGAAQTGSHCWNWLAYDASTPTAWAGAAGAGSTNGGVGVATTDYETTNATNYDYTAESVGSVIPVSLPTLWVTDWRDSVVTNSGFICRQVADPDSYPSIPANNTVRWYSSDSGTSPIYFEIDYTPAAPPSGSGLFFMGGW